MLRVYLDKKLAFENSSQRADKPVQVDKGRIVCGVQIPEGRKLFEYHVKHGKHVCRIDLYTKESSSIRQRPAA